MVNGECLDFIKKNSRKRIKNIFTENLISIILKMLGRVFPATDWSH